MPASSTTQTILVTGGSGFFGGVLLKELLNRNFFCVSIDLQPNSLVHPNLLSIQGDIRDIALLEQTAQKYQFDAIFHLAAMLAHAVSDRQLLWTSNVDGTKNVAELAKRFGVGKVVFTSSNCLWGKSFDRPVKETDQPEPVEVYGQSKWEGEKVLQQYTDFHSVIFRCPTIVDAGRLGLLAILFEFIDEGRRVWVVGGGNNIYQFIYAQDLAQAFIKALNYDQTAIFNIGSDDVPSFRQAYQYVIDKAGTHARLATFPRMIAIPLMKLAYLLKISPLGPYQYKMIAENFIFDTTKIKQALKWKPTLTNAEMLYKAYQYYHDHLYDIKEARDVSAHKQAAKMGVIRLLKWVS